MRVLRVIGGVDPAMGGPSVSSLNSCVAANAAGIEHVVVFPVDGDAPQWARRAASRLRDEGIPVELYPLSRLLRGRARGWGVSFPLIRRVVREARRYDAVHAHGGWTLSTVAALVAARIARRPAILTPHESLTAFDIAKSGRLGRAVKRVIRSMYRRSFDLFVFSSELERRDSLGAALRVRSVVIYHPVTAAANGTVEHRASRQVGFLGRLDPKKNLDLVVRALALLPADVTLVVAGAGPLEDDLRRLAESCRVAERITWLGFIGSERKDDFFESIDVLAMPSANECFGMSAAEAMMRGVPVIVSPHVGIAEVIEPAGAGLVVAASPEELAAALRTVLDDDSLRRELAVRALEAGAREFSLEAHGRRLRHAYEGLTGVRSSADEPTHTGP